MDIVLILCNRILIKISKRDLLKRYIQILTMTIKLNILSSLKFLTKLLENHLGKMSLRRDTRDRLILKRWILKLRDLQSDLIKQLIILV